MAGTPPPPPPPPPPAQIQNKPVETQPRLAEYTKG
jgi:hypothetical protein